MIRTKILHRHRQNNYEKMDIIFTFIISILLIVLMNATLPADTTIATAKDSKAERKNKIYKTYTLETYLLQVKKHSKDLALARQELEMAQVYKKEAKATALPKIKLEADYKRNLKKNYLFIDFPDSETGEISNQKFKINYKNDYGINAVLNQTLFSFKVGTALTAAKQYKKLTEFLHEATLQTILKVSRKAFYRTLLLKQVWQVSRNSQENAQENYRQMEKKYQHGQISQFHLLQSETRWQNTIPETTQARRNYRLALNSLKTLAGIPGDRAIECSGDFNRVPAIPKEVALDAALDIRPDYNALVWEKEMRKTSVKNEKANLMPSLDLNMIYNFSSMSDKLKFQRKNTSYIVNLKLSVPIFAGGYNRAQVQRAKIELEKSRIKLEKKRETIYNDMRNIFLRLKEAQNRMLSAKKTLATAKKAFEIAEVTAANGLATQLELKDTRLIFDQAHLNSYAAAYDYLDAYFDWQEAVGKGQ
ncbi:MAG: TolC family protein [bacterium]|nr:TolC family protein [bacterium]